MIRLTRQIECDNVVMDCDHCELQQDNNCGLYGCRQRLMRRLGLFENTGRTPEEVLTDQKAAETLRLLCQYCDLSRLERIAKADSEGRVIIKSEECSKDAVAAPLCSGEKSVDQVREFANRLSGREYMSEISAEEEREAREKGLVIVFGYSDDCIEFRGAIDDELGC